MANIEIRLIIFFAATDGEALYSQQKQDRELIVAQIISSLLQNSDLNWKIGKPTGSLRYDLNHIPNDYTVEVTNRFKGLDLTECLKYYGQRFVTLYRRHDQDHPQENGMQKGKMVVWGGLTNNWEKKRSYKGEKEKLQRRKWKIYPSECRVPKNRKER